MAGFPEGHERLVALEWLVQRLAVEHCLARDSPLDEAGHIVKAADDYGMLMIEHASKSSGNSDNLLTAISIASALKELVEHLAADVRARL